MVIEAYTFRLHWIRIPVDNVVNGTTVYFERFIRVGELFGALLVHGHVNRLSSPPVAVNIFLFDEFGHQVEIILLAVESPN